MSQLSYNYTLQNGYEGLPTFNPGSGRTVRNNSGAEIPYGRMLVFDGGSGTTNIAAKLPSADTDTFLGVLAYDHAHEPQVTGLPDDAIGTVLGQGKILMLTEQAVTPADPVFVRYDVTGATGTNPALGKVRKDADSAKAVAAPNLKFLTSAAAGGLVEVLVNLP